jgi:uncharacterized protein (DUF697 family)
MKIFEAIGDLGGGNYHTATDRERGAKELTEKCGYAAAALTIIPLPGSEWVAVMPLHVGMVMGIAQIYGKEVSRDSARELVLRIGATVGLSLMGSHVATTAAKVILPGLGGLLAAPFMYASTQAIGAVARLYFEQGGISDEELESVYKDTLKRARKQFDPARARSNEAKDLANAATAEAGDAAPEPATRSTADQDPVARLERLKALLDKGLIEPEEYDAVKKRVLDSI